MGSTEPSGTQDIAEPNSTEISLHWLVLNWRKSLSQQFSIENLIFLEVIAVEVNKLNQYLIVRPIVVDELQKTHEAPKTGTWNFSRLWRTWTPELPCAQNEVSLKSKHIDWMCVC